MNKYSFFHPSTGILNALKMLLCD